MLIRLLILILTFSCSSGLLAQNKSATSKAYFPFTFDSVYVELPIGFKMSHFHYDEGDYFTYSYPDTFSITFHNGGNVVLPLLSEAEYIITKKDTNSREGTVGKDRYWKEVNLGDINILYTHAPLGYKDQLDKAIDDLIKQIKLRDQRLKQKHKK